MEESRRENWRGVRSGRGGGVEEDRSWVGGKIVMWRGLDWRLLV